jgi:hypothetical protein
MVVLRPVSFSLQFLAGVGVPLLSLGAIGLGRLRRGLLEAAVPLFAGTTVMVTALQFPPNLYRNVPAERWRVADALRDVCRPGELVLAPSDIGLYVGGLSSCWPWVSHTASPEHASREAATARFYSGAPPERGRFLDALCVTHVVLPRAWPAGGLPPGTPYHLGPTVDGPGGGLAVYSRETDASCRPASP